MEFSLVSAKLNVLAICDGVTDSNAGPGVLTKMVDFDALKILW